MYYFIRTSLAQLIFATRTMLGTLIHIPVIVWLIKNCLDAQNASATEYITITCLWLTALWGAEIFLHQQQPNRVAPLGLWSFANTITALRIIGSFFLVPHLVSNAARAPWWATTLFILLCLTDFIDGWLARKIVRTTIFGALLDPFADKIVLFTTTILLAYAMLIPAWVVVLLIAREIAIMYLRLYALSNGIIVRVSWAAKIKTALQLITLSLIISHQESHSIQLLTKGCLYITLICSIGSALEYLYGVVCNLRMSPPFLHTLEPSLKEQK